MVTLIELLAVIVILVILTLIVAPIIMNTIEKGEDNAILSSAELYIDTADVSVLSSELRYTKTNDGTYSITQDGNICLGAFGDKVCDGNSSIVVICKDETFMTLNKI